MSFCDLHRVSGQVCGATCMIFHFTQFHVSPPCLNECLKPGLSCKGEVCKLRGAGMREVLKEQENASRRRR